MKSLIAITLLCTLAACAAGDPQSSANAVTRAIYDNDDGVKSYFDGSLQPKVTRASVAVISDKMHALGNYNGLTLVARDTSKNEYTYRANFSQGSMNIVVRYDGDGKLAAYRVYPAG